MSGRWGNGPKAPVWYMTEKRRQNVIIELLSMLMKCERCQAVGLEFSEPDLNNEKCSLRCSMCDHTKKLEESEGDE